MRVWLIVPFSVLHLVQRSSADFLREFGKFGDIRPFVAFEWEISRTSPNSPEFQALEYYGKKSYHMGMKSVVSEKGQVTIPKVCRDRLGLKAGTVLQFEARDGKLIAVKQPAADALSKWRGKGKLPGALNVDQYLEIIRK
jgi:AbrB family looped-hinge helix DNA binding protein